MPVLVLVLGAGCWALEVLMALRRLQHQHRSTSTRST